MSISRRGFLGGLGAAALLTPATGLLRRAAAQSLARPKRLVVVTWPVGLEPGWQPIGGERDFQMSEALAPFAPLRDRMLIVDGLRGSTSNLLLAHSEGTVGLWTGATPKGGLQELATHPSIDQVVAQRLGKDTPYASLHFGVQTNRSSFISNPYVHYAGPNQPVPAQDDPNAIYKLLFESFGDAAALERVRRERRSVLDFVTGELQRVNGALDTEDRFKVEKHLDGVRSIERSLDALGGQCGANAQAPSYTAETAMLDANFPAVIRLQTELLVAALQCDFTRVATLQLSNTDSQTIVPGLQTQRTVHSAQHDGSSAEAAEINRFFMGELARFLQLLATTEASPGQSLLDETLVVMSTEMATGDHANEPTPFLLAGGGSSIRTGRYLKLPTVQQHTRLLAAIAQAMGLAEIDRFGEFAADGGALPGISS